MKISIFIVVALLIYNFSFSQNKISENNKIESLIQVWGLLKYKHPSVSEGKVDFDKEFIHEFNKIKSIDTQIKFNSELSNWIKGFNSKKEKIKIKSRKSSRLFTKNDDYSWITNSNFHPELIRQLNQLKNNTNYGKHYGFVNKMSSSVDFNYDKEFIEFDAKKESHRFLFLASFWNKMRYWNVNIYLTDKPWNKVLENIIPDFLNDDKIKYELAKDKLFAGLNDSHSNYSSGKFYNIKNRKYSLYGGRIVNDTLVIKTLFNKELANSEGIEIGDLIYSINGKKISEYYTGKFSKSVSVSNKNYLKSVVERANLLSSDDSLSSLKIGLVKKNDTKKEQQIKLYKFTNKNYKPISLTDTLASVKWRKIRNNVGYINLKTIDKPELKKAFKAFKNTTGIVIDLRNYPRNLNATDLPYFLYPKKKVFMKILTSFAPGIGKYDTQSALKIIKNPFAAGRNNKNYYKGKVVLLVDRITGSMAEYFAMAIQNSPNCITIGEQTFGAVMNRNQVILKDKTTIDYTGVGAFYPNDKNVQRKGIQLDVTIKEKAKNYSPYQYIDEAIKIIQKKE